MVVVVFLDQERDVSLTCADWQAISLSAAIAAARIICVGSRFDYANIAAVLVSAILWFCLQCTTRRLQSVGVFWCPRSLVESAIGIIVLKIRVASCGAVGRHQGHTACVKGHHQAQSRMLASVNPEGHVTSTTSGLPYPGLGNTGVVSRSVNRV
jgi:hypothetical protein